MATKEEVANWMVNEVNTKPHLYQEGAARTINNQFGEEFTYKNKNHNLAINKEVLDEFNKQTKETVVWIKSDRCWRLRKERDKPSRQQ
jgi:hypothetical protein